jgi:hypothetical protein
MEGDLFSIGMEIMNAVNQVKETNFGDTIQSNLQIKMNEIDEEAGIGAKGQLLLAGPTLDKLKEQGSVLFPDKSDDDMFVYISFRTKGDPQEFIDQVQGLIEAFGLPMDMLEQFGELKFQAADGEAMIGFKAADNEYAQLAKGFTVESGVFGDGSQDITVDGSINLGTTFTDMLDDNPLFTHFLKSMSIHIQSIMHLKTRENILKVLSEKKDQLDPIINVFPFAIILLLFKKMDGVLELQCTDDMIENLKNTAQNANPMAVMSLKEVFSFIKMAGLPIEMIQPILELIQNNTAGEISINGFNSVGFKVTVRLPGLDQAVSSFLTDS